MESGGRVIDAIITQSVLPELSACVMRAMIDGIRVKAVHMTSGVEGFRFTLTGAAESAVEEVA